MLARRELEYHRSRLVSSDGYCRSVEDHHDRLSVTRSGVVLVQQGRGNPTLWLSVH